MKRLIFLLFICISNAGFANVTIYKLAIPGLHQGNNKGAYDKYVLGIDGSKVRLSKPNDAFARFESCKRVLLVASE